MDIQSLKYTQSQPTCKNRGGHFDKNDRNGRQRMKIEPMNVKHLSLHRICLHYKRANGMIQTFSGNQKIITWNTMYPTSKENNVKL